MKKLFTILILMAGSVTAQFDNVGTSVANFLKIGVGGRAEGMGGAYVAQVQDPSALYWNPAGIAHITQAEVLFNSTNWIADIQHDFLGAVVPIGRLGSVGLSISYLTMGDMLETTVLAPEGTGRKISASDVAIGLGYARKISESFAVGIQAKLVQESISFTKATAVAIDAGSQYRTNFSNLTIGMAITNFGSKMRLYGTDQLIDFDVELQEGIDDAIPQITGRLNTKDWALPLGFRFGVSMTPVGQGGIISNPLVDATINVEYFDPRDVNPYYVTGMEVKVLNMLFLRGGLQYKFHKYDESLDESASIDNLTQDQGYVNGMAYGVGFSSASFPFIPYKFQVDYSVSDMGVLKPVTRLTVSMQL